MRQKSKNHTRSQKRIARLLKTVRKHSAQGLLEYAMVLTLASVVVLVAMRAAGKSARQDSRPVRSAMW